MKIKYQTALPAVSNEFKFNAEINSVCFSSNIVQIAMNVKTERDE